MRTSKVVLAAALCAAVSAIAIGTGARLTASASEPATTPPTLAQCLQLVKTEVHTKNKMTVATDNPVYPPWFVNNSPSNGKGYESAVAYHVALSLGYKHAAVAWVTQPYATSTLGGPKPFDFDINEITYAKHLTTSVAFSTSYFNLNQSIVALKSNKVVSHHSATALKTYLYGAQTASAGLAFIQTKIKPTRPPIAYKTLDGAIAALQAKHIDAIVVDTPDGQYIATRQLIGGTQPAQFRTTGSYYALVLQKANPLVACVDTALRSLSKSGEIARLSRQYLSVYNAIPFIAP
jgi:polar amino acid transport system substrate-binding protein